MRKRESCVALFPLGVKLSIKDFKRAMESGDTKCHIQAYLNQLLVPINRISLEELSYAMAVSMANDNRPNDDIELCVKILNDFLLALPSQRFKRIESNLKNAKADMRSNVHELFTYDFIALIEFFEGLALKVSQ